MNSDIKKKEGKNPKVYKPFNMLYSNKLTENQNLLISFFGLIIISIIVEHIQLGRFGQVYKFGYHPLRYQLGVYLGNLFSFTFFSFFLGVIGFLTLKFKKRKIYFKGLIFRCNYSILLIYLFFKGISFF